MKASPARLVRAHYKTYVNANNGKQLWRDHVFFEGLPLAVLVACWTIGVTLPAGASVGLLTVAGLLSAFLFGVTLQISERAMDWADAKPEKGHDTSEHAIFLGEIAANAGYASLVSIATAAVFVAASVTVHTDPEVLTAVGLALATHLALVLLMVLTRVFALTQDRLTRARTQGSATVSQLPQKRSNTG
jgi:hypothetical protein